jgi:hypothetical protein
MSGTEQYFSSEINKSDESKKEKPQLTVLKYGPGEVRMYAVTDKSFKDQDSLDAFMKMAAKTIGLSINDWSLQQYGEKRFRLYDDGVGVRVQTGFYELTKEDRDKLQEIVSSFNESCR